MSPTARTLQALRTAGYTVDIVERWIPRANIRRDLFGCIDLVAVREDESGVLGVQATSLSNISARVRKAQGRPELVPWLAAGNRWECWGWDGARCKRVALRAGDLEPVVMEKPTRRARRDRQPGLFGDDLAA